MNTDQIHTTPGTLSRGLGSARQRILAPLRDQTIDRAVDQTPPSVPAAPPVTSAESVVTAKPQSNRPSPITVPSNETDPVVSPSVNDADSAEAKPVTAVVGDRPSETPSDAPPPAPKPEPKSKGESTRVAADVAANTDTEQNGLAEQKELAENGFASLGLPEAVSQTLQELNYVTPTPIQAATIPAILAGRDVLGQAQTGTGKTAAFALPLLANLDVNQRHPQVLVLCPTRELAIQVGESFHRYAQRIGRLNIACVYGGQSYQPQIRALRQGAHVVVGTPGRIMDHMKQGTLKIDQLRALVLDEADEMLQMGFLEDVEFVLSHTPDSRQIALFSATMPPAIRQIAEQYLSDPEVVKIKGRQTTADTIKQQFLVVKRPQKFEALARLLEAEDSDGVIVFTRTKVTTVEVAEALSRRGFSAAALNGDIAQNMRERIVSQMKDRKLDVLVATDVAARGLDIQRVSHVINYDLPHDSESYVHRIGRTGRAGRSGVAILLVTAKERRGLSQIQRQSGNSIQEIQLPSVETMNQARVQRFQQRIREAMNRPQTEVFSKMLSEWMASEELDPLQVAAALAHLAQGSEPLLLNEIPQGRPQRDGNSRGNAQGYETYRVAVGKKDRIQAKHIVGAIANESALGGDDIGRIRLFDSFSLVDLPAGMQDELMAELSDTKVGGRLMRLQPDRFPSRRSGHRDAFSEEGRPGKGRKYAGKGGGGGKKPGKYGKGGPRTGRRK